MDYTCGVFIFNRNGDVLICKPTGARWNQWSIPKGLRDINESNIDAAVREVEEESGIILDKTKVKFIGTYPYKSKKKTLIAYYTGLKEDHTELNLNCISMVHVPGGDPFPEVCEYKWVSIQQAIQYVHETQQKCLEQLESLMLLNNI